jgi:hypothetical protein
LVLSFPEDTVAIGIDAKDESRSPLDAVRFRVVYQRTELRIIFKVSSQSVDTINKSVCQFVQVVLRLIPYRQE